MNPTTRCPRCETTYLGRLCPNCAGAAPASDTLPAGHSIRGFEILEVIGRGGMGIVYKAKQTALERVVALKVLPPDKANLPGFQARFEREAKALASLTHPNIVTIHDFGREGDQYFIAMELVDGPSLRQVIRDRKPGEEEIRRIAGQLFDALECAHRAGVVHRDLKPENVLIDRTDRVRVVDFGLAKTGEHGLTQTGAIVGTAHYMAPEQLSNSENVDARADVYALGVVLFELMTGELPMGTFEAPTPAIRKALAKNPAERFGSIAEFRDAFVGRKQSRALPIAAAVLLVLSAGALLLWRFPRAKKHVPPAPVPIRAELPAEARTFSTGTVTPSVSLRPDGRVLAAAHECEITFWNALTGAQTNRWKAAGSTLMSIAYSPDGRFLAIGGDGGSVRDAETGEERFAITGHLDAIRALAFTPDGKYLATAAGLDRTILIWDCSTGKLFRKLPRVGTGNFGLAFSPDGSRLATAGFNGDILIWPREGEGPVSELEGHQGTVLALAFCPELGRLVSVGNDRTMRIWNLSNDQLQTTLSEHEMAVLSIAVRGRRAVTGSKDGRVILWDLERPAKMRDLAHHPDQVRSVQFRSDGRLVVSASADGTVTLSPVPD